MIKIKNGKDFGYNTDRPALTVSHVLDKQDMADFIRAYVKGSGEASFIQLLKDLGVAKALLAGQATSVNLPVMYYNRVAGHTPPVGGHKQFLSIANAYKEADRLALLPNNVGKAVCTIRSRDNYIERKVCAELHLKEQQ